MKLLSICIPTYNRASLLKENLEVLLPQITDKKNVEVLIFDNNSIDETEEVVKIFIERYSNIKYQKNESNVGYVGNQIYCIKNSNSKYTAILCDDDIYVNGSVNEILNHININEDFSFIALNYFSFRSDYTKIENDNYAPPQDKYFNRPYDILNYPSVGHFSGFIFNNYLAKSELKKIEEKHGNHINSFFEKNRGIISHLANMILSTTNLRSCFIGKRILAARIPKVIDYDFLYHLNYDYIKYYNELYSNGIIKKSDYDYRKNIILHTLPKAIFIESTIKSLNEYIIIRSLFDELLLDNLKYKYLIRPLFRLTQIKTVKYFWLLFYKKYKSI
jgi:glycosyltransferase involved in cell wall biosynthesis